MASLAETFVTKSYDKKGKPVPDMKKKPAKPKGLMATPMKKASAGTKKAVAKAGEMQRREMSRTRLKQQTGRMTAEERRKVTDRDKAAAIEARAKVTRQKFKQSVKRSY